MSLLVFFLHKAYSCGLHGYQTTLIEVADGTLEDLLRHLESTLDSLSIGLIAHIADAVMTFKIVEKCGSEILGLPHSRWLQRTVYLPVRTYCIDISRHTVTGMHVPEYLIIIDKAAELIVDDDLKAQISLLPDEKANLGTVVIGFHILRSDGREIFIYFCGSHETVALFVDMDVDDIALADFHLLFLFAERTEQVLGDTPIEESTVLVDPRALQIGKFTGLSQRLLRGGYGAFLLVEIYEGGDIIAYLRTFRTYFAGMSISPSAPPSRKRPNSSFSPTLAPVCL